MDVGMTDETHYAFPHKFQSSPNETTVCFGMTLRDYFAAKAMQAILSDPNYSNPDDKLAASAYYIADAMMKAREQ
jgi:hypothetical protein